MYRKKIFIQGSPALWAPAVVCLAIMAAAVYVIVNVLYNAAIIGFKNVGILYWIGFVAALCAIVYFGRFIICSAFNRIVFTDLALHVTGTLGKSSLNFQGEEYIYYDEIKNIYITSGADGQIEALGKGFLTNVTYIAFDCGAGGVKAINALFYTKKQLVKIIDCSAERVNALSGERLSLSGERLLSEFLLRKKMSKAK